MKTFRRLSSRIRLSPGGWAALAFFVSLLILGLAIYRDYGIAWDEPTQVDLGLKTYRYVMQHDPALLSFRDRYYGPFFELLLVKFQSHGASQEMYYSRHLLNFLCFFAGCLAFYTLGKYLYKKSWLALLGCGFLVLSPRIFADSFYNSKDIPFLVFYIFSLLSLVVLLDHPGPITAILHGLVTAALLAIRLPGLIIPALTLAGLLIEVLAHRLRWSRAVGCALLYLSISLAALILFWPALWPNPLVELPEAFRMMKNFPHETVMLYFGQTLDSTALPWHYIPVWIAITTPLPYLVLFLVGLGRMVAGWIKAPHDLLTPTFRNQLILFGALFLPIAAVILLDSTLYDGWRQLFFIYPPLLLIALSGVDRLFQWKIPLLSRRTAQFVLSALLAVSLAPVLVWMVANHPFQNVYFNRLAGPDLSVIRSNFPVDYWGLSYRKGLEFLLQSTSLEKIPVYVETEPGRRNAAIFPPDQERRFEFVSELSQAKYYIGNYDHEKSYPFKKEVYATRVDGTPILSVFLLSEEEKR